MSKKQGMTGKKCAFMGTFKFAGQAILSRCPSFDLHARDMQLRASATPGRVFRDNFSFTIQIGYMKHWDIGRPMRSTLRHS